LLFIGIIFRFLSRYTEMLCVDQMIGYKNRRCDTLNQ
jgi:hypothetical protein